MTDQPIPDRETLTETERARLIAALTERGALNACEMCRNKEWELGEQLVTPVIVTRVTGRTVMDQGGRLHTSAVLLCVKCGNTKLINIGMLGMADILPQSQGTPRVQF